MKCPMKFGAHADGDASCDKDCAWIMSYRKNEKTMFCALSAMAAARYDDVLVNPCFVNGIPQANTIRLSAHGDAEAAREND